MPVGMDALKARQTLAREFIKALCKNTTIIDEKDRGFVLSLGEQAASYSDKQLQYIVGDENGLTPKGFASLRKRYSDRMTDQIIDAVDTRAPSGKLSISDQTFIDAMTVDELEEMLDEAFEAGDRVIATIDSDPKLSYARRRYLQLT